MSADSGNMTLDEAARAAGDLLVDVSGSPGAVVTGVCSDSRAVRAGDLFFCVPGRVTDGHRFAGDAVAAGVTALCVQRPVSAGVAEIRVKDVRRAMPLIAAAYYGRPGDDLLLIGVTGTNGKTTTAFLLESILRSAGHTTGLIGTIETRIAGRAYPGVRTTPESVDLQRVLHDMRARGVTAVAMEVTSHGLVLNRVDALKFSAVAFTNLSQDHLDFHKDMQDYFEAKRSLFVPARASNAAINLDDPYGRRLAGGVEIPVLGFGTASDADVRPADVQATGWGSDFVVVAPHGEMKVSTSLVGTFNISNCLAATASALQAGIGLEHIAAGINDLRAVPGRFEAVDSGQPFTVVVDYAHTADSLDNVLRQARHVAELQQGRVICVFGCGGDRDRAKRPLMGAVAARLTDVVVVTSDNPRSEDPLEIIDHILEGVVAESPDGPDLVEPDRRAAIAAAFRWARPKDVVILAGKGHETGQQFADGTIPFDDRVVAREELSRLGWGSAP